MKLGIVKIINFKDGTQKGSYTSLSDRQILAENEVSFNTKSFGNLIREEAVAKTFPA